MQRDRAWWIELRRRLWRLCHLGGFAPKAVGALPPFFRADKEDELTRQLGLELERARRDELGRG